MVQESPSDELSGLNATDKMPMYEMPLIYVFGVGESIFCIGVLGNGILSLAFVPRSTGEHRYAQQTGLISSEWTSLHTKHS